MRQSGTRLPGSVAMLRNRFGEIWSNCPLLLASAVFLLFRLLSAWCFYLLLLLDALPSLRIELNGCSLVPELNPQSRSQVSFRLLSLLLCSVLLCLGSSAKFLRSSPVPVLRPCAAPDSIRSPQSQAISYQFAGPHGSPRGAIE